MLGDLLWLVGGALATALVIVAVLYWGWQETRASRSAATLTPPPADPQPPIP